MSAIQALQLWCKQKCDGYKDVHITNMTTSFRDGLAFCAILHRHRPDLIDFNSLSKENIYENNQRAFQVAERELGIPALLDAEDMVNMKVPDRLSILTYVSQYYNYFHGRSPIGGMGGIKRSPSDASEQPAGKKAVSERVTPALVKSPPRHQKVDPTPQGRSFPKENAPVLARPVLAENNNTRSSGCAICGGHVHLVQRLLVDGKLYHRNCFRCRKCFNTLQSGNYKAGTEPGTLVCNKHDPPKHLPNSSPVNTRAVAGENKPVGTSPAPGSYLKGLEPKKPVQERLRTNPVVKGSDAVKAEVWDPPNSKNNKSSAIPATPVSCWPDSIERKPGCHESTTSPPASQWTASSAKTQQAREKFFQSEIRTSSPAAEKTEPVKNRVSPLTPPQATGQASTPGLNTSGTNSGSGEKDKARSFLMHALPGGSPSSSRQPGIIRDTQPSSPTSGTAPCVVSKSGKPPPMSKELDNKVDPGMVTQKAPPFSSQPADFGRKVDIKATKVVGGNTTEEKLESPADWRSRLKPVANKPCIQYDGRTSQKPADIHRVKIDITPSVAQKEIKPTSPAASRFIENTAPSANQPQKKKLLVPNSDLSNDWQKSRQQWEEVPAVPKTEERGFPRKTVAPIKPSPPRPFQNLSRNQVTSPNKSRPDYIPEEEIQKELRQIENNLDELEHKGVDLEKQLRGCEGDEKEDALMVEWFKLIHEKQLLMRRESELMHKMNQQKLEEEQWGIEVELRNLMNTPESLKSPKEKARESELLDSYLAAVDGRNKIVENLDEDRLREREEDEMLAAMIQKFDLPRTNQENEKKKTKFGLFRMRKSKNKAQE